MKNVNVGLRPLVTNINLPTVMKTAFLPGDIVERLFIATQVGEVFFLRNGEVQTFIDIRSRIIELGASGGYDERGLLGLAFHPQFYYNGVFYLHFSVAGSQGPGALSNSFTPDSCDPSTLNLKWEDRNNQYDHIDTVEEWILQTNGQPKKRRTLLNLKRPFFNHNGFNSLNFSPETGNLVLSTGDGGSGYDPFNLSQDNLEIAGKIIEIDVSKTFPTDLPAVTRFDELPNSIQEALAVVAKGVRNNPGISYQRYGNQSIKYVGNVGQDLVESIFSFVYDQRIPVKQLIQFYSTKKEPKGLINFGWRGWEGAFPTSILENCSENSMDKQSIAYYIEAVKDSVNRLPPLTCYFHQDSRPDKFEGTALTGVQPYMSNEIPDLTGSIVFTDMARNKQSESPVRGGLAYTKVRFDGKLNDYGVIEPSYDFGSQPAYYVGLGTNLVQTNLYLGVYHSMKVSDLNQGTVFEIIP
ncbi:PQQ-dependent sugar dehydrogenase [Metabacillus litoralis]|uniref:PQQ-dependent sugar dehydrogenase n=1 Tax=Metabacillus litoralis TaxID=152268 RepID=UPI001CFE0787|nr:PQQ-dependent sugar dehydrogenase [Metabacillus litoralis]